MTKVTDDNTIFIDGDSTKRFNSRRSHILDTINILTTNNPKRIIKLDSEERIRERKNRLAQHQLPDVSIERIITGNDLMPVFYFEKGRKTADSVCRIELMDPNGNVLGHGTGFMISPSLLITYLLVKKIVKIVSLNLILRNQKTYLTNHTLVFDWIRINFSIPMKS
jgi:hypothetical protein